jgi:flagellar basal-body rod protein FlgG
MLNALSTAATGLEAQQTKIANIANDLANVNTDGYKASGVEFDELFYQTIQSPGDSTGTTSQAPVGIQIGNGVKVGAIVKNFTPGPVKMTYQPYDWMIEGNGFFQVQAPNNETLYTRKGALRLDATGALQLSNGSKLLPIVQIPPNAINVHVSRSGEITASFADGSINTLGQLQLANFQNAQGLLAKSEGLYKATPASGPPIMSIPGENGTGTLLQGALEGSNVNIASSMIDMISTQRAYEMGTKVMGAVDQMLAATVNLK